MQGRWIAEERNVRRRRAALNLVVVRIDAYALLATEYGPPIDGKTRSGRHDATACAGLPRSIV